MDKLLGRSKSDLQALQDRIRERYKDRAPLFGNKVSIAMNKSILYIDSILSNEKNFKECNVCGEYKYKGDITEKFVHGLDVCIECQENRYYYCEDCGVPIYNESQEQYILDDCIYCEDCYFIAKDRIISDWNIVNKKVKALYRLLQIKGLPVNYDNIKSYNFIIKKYNFNVEKYSTGFRLGSWEANGWIDLCSNESDILKAIDYITEKNGERITDIKL